MSKKLSLVVVVALLMAVPVQAHLYSSDYEDYTVGGTIVSQSGSWWSPGSAAVVAVDPLDSENQVLDMVGGASTFWLSGYGYDDVTDAVVAIDMDVYLSDTTQRAVTYAITDNDSSDVIYNAYGRSGASTIDWHTGVAWATVAAPTADATWMHFRYVLDQVNNTYSLIVDGTPVLTNVNTWNDPITTNTSTFDQDNDNSLVLVDNIAVSVVPEPMTCVLLGLGGLGLLRRNRK